MSIKGTTDSHTTTELFIEPNAYYDDEYDLVILTNGECVINLPLSKELLSLIKKEWNL